MKRILLSSFLYAIMAMSTTAQTNSFQHFTASTTPVFANTGNAFKAVEINRWFIWAGTQYKGLFLYDTMRKVWHQAPQLTNVFINDIKVDRANGIWVAQSGILGTVGGGSSISGGVNYFPLGRDTAMEFYSVPGTTTGGGLSSRNVRSIFVDKTYQLRGNADNPYLPRVWAAQANFITSFNTSAGGLGVGLYPEANFFRKRIKAIDAPPLGSSTPSFDAVAGEKLARSGGEVWASVRQNYGRSQILRYNTQLLQAEGQFLGAWDHTNTFTSSEPPVPVFQNGFKVNAMYFDKEGRRWMGLQTGGVRVWINGNWYILDMPGVFPAGITINNNAITEDHLGNIYFGTTAGLIKYNNGGDVTNSSFYETFRIIDGFLSNNITGLAFDYAKLRMIVSSDAGVSFWSVIDKIKVSLEWDYSYPLRTESPRGVAADGVSRVYLKIENGEEGLPPIDKVKVRVKNYVEAEATLRGQLKIANNIFSYSTEASAGLENEVESLSPNVTYEDGRKEFWFWYRSPKDFSKDGSSVYANESMRIDQLEIEVTYINGTTETRSYSMKVVRPPLVLVHGLASGPSTWDNFKHNETFPFVKSDRFKYVNAITISGRDGFHNNAKLILSGNRLEGMGKNFYNTLQGNIEAMREKGYAANQVDYVCHSMGGVVIRYAIAHLPFKFYTNERTLCSNYDQGYTHKVITINTPHNSSPVADAVAEFIPNLPKNTNRMLAGVYWHDKSFQFPYDFIEPKDKSIEDIPSTIMQPTPAVRDLQITDTRDGERAGVNLRETNTKFHIITGNVELLSEQTTTTMAEFFPSVKYVQGFIETLLASDYVPGVVKERLKPFLVAADVLCVALFWEWYCQQKGFPNYLSSSDLIVPLESQLARIPQSEVKPYITRFGNSEGSLYDASHVTILGRTDVGQRVFDLLGSSVSSDLFGDVIPANIDTDPPQEYTDAGRRAGLHAGRPQAGEEFYDSTKIKIDFPTAGSTVFADSVLNIRFRLKDTANLSYIKVHFQLKDSFTLTKTFTAYNMPMTIIPEFPGLQTIWAVAAYNTPDNRMKYHIDTLSVSVGNNAPVTGFRVNDSNVVIQEGNFYYPNYQVLRGGRWINLPNSDTTVKVSFIPTGIVTRYDSTGEFVPLQEGITEATFRYGNFTDAVIIEAAMLNNGFCINKTIAAGSFKNPSIWSKGTVPEVCDSVIIDHAIVLDTSVLVSAIRINAGKSLTLNNAGVFTTVENTSTRSVIDNYGTLTVNNGNLQVAGSMHHRQGSSFIMTGGKISLVGNYGFEELGVPDGEHIFDAATGMAQFSFTGGTLEITDPPYGETSEAVNCTYNFGINSTLLLGNGISVTASKNLNGFGGNGFPAIIGNLIVDGVTQNNNRQLTITKPLNVKGSFLIRTGSNTTIKAQTNVTP